MWSLLPTTLVASHLYLPLVLRFNDDVTLLIIPFPFLFWGTIAGLLYKDDVSFFQRYTIFRNPLLTLFVSSLFIAVIMSIWIQIVDPIEIGGYIYRIFASMSMAIFILPFVVGPFFVGYVSARAVRF